VELPEVEVLRKDLEKEAVGKKVKDADVMTPSVVKPFHRTRPEFAKALEGRKIEAVRRRGRTLFVDLDDETTWVVDPGEGGILHRETASQAPGPDTHVTVSFTVGGAVHVSESGEPTICTGVVPTEDSYDAAGINPDALDLLDDNPTWMEFGRFLAEADKPLKLLLIDPEFIVGLGPITSDEILWEAGLRHDHPSSTLSTQEVRRLYRATQEVIVAAMKAAGSSFDDGELDAGDDDEVAEHLKVHGREGLPCPRCRRTIVRTRIRKGVYTFHCEQCMI
jgi:formamidopyrimidine-DNA glycosylase